VGVLREVIARVTLDGEYSPEDPITEKLAVYTLAHRNYLHSLNYRILTHYKVNWGLRKIKKLEE
jgi:hypothetical protein